jgi:hypothetical protein
MQRHPKSRGHRQTDIAVKAPVPDVFREVCSRFDIPLDKEDVEGAYFINGESVSRGEMNQLWGNTEAVEVEAEDT